MVVMVVVMPTMMMVTPAVCAGGAREESSRQGDQQNTGHSVPPKRADDAAFFCRSGDHRLVTQADYQALYGPIERGQNLRYAIMANHVGVGVEVRRFAVDDRQRRARALGRNRQTGRREHHK